MTYIAFSSISNDDVHVNGCERAWIGVMTSGIFAGMLRSSVNNNLDILIQNNVIPSSYNNYALASVFLRTAMTPMRIGGKSIDLFQAALNTALVIGNDTMKLCARIHGQCELHLYIMPENAMWVQSLIKDGLDTKILRRDMGWEKLAELLCCKEPIVMSYSGTDDFPNRYVTQFCDDDMEDEWYKLSYEDRFYCSLRCLDKQLEIKPDGFSEYRFGHNLSAIDIDEMIIDMVNNRYEIS